MRVLVAFTAAALLVAPSLLAVPALVHAHPIATSYLAIRFRPAWRLVALAGLIACARRLRDHHQLRRWPWARTRGGALAITFALGLLGPISPTPSPRARRSRSGCSASRCSPRRRRASRRCGCRRGWRRALMITGCSPGDHAGRRRGYAHPVAAAITITLGDGPGFHVDGPAAVLDQLERHLRPGSRM